jgi:hypothetical protein
VLYTYPGGKTRVQEYASGEGHARDAARQVAALAPDPVAEVVSRQGNGPWTPSPARDIAGDARPGSAGG